MSAISDFEAGVRSVIREAWPEVFGNPHPILRVTQAQRRAWRSLVEKQELQFPYAIVQTPPLMQVGGFGACNETYAPLVTVFYVTHTDEAIKAGSTDVAGFVHGKLDALADVLKYGDTPGFQLSPTGWDFVRDVSETNPVNAALTPSNQSLFGGSLSFRALFGTIER